MKTRTYKILAISIMTLLAASCQKEELHPQGADFSATAVIREPVATKVDYSSDAEANEISQQWTVGDTVIGFDNLDQAFTFTVSSINNGKATFSLGGYAPGNATKAYAVFYPGKTAFNSDHTLAVDITSQNGILSTETPVLMCATADIRGDKVEFEFENQAAVIEVKKFQVEPSQTVSSLKIGGLAATGTFQVVDGAMTLVPSTSPSTIAASVNLTADGEGVVDTPVFFAALATQDAHITVQAVAGGKTYDNANAVPVTDVEAGHLYYMSKKLAQVARVGSATYSSLASALAACTASHLRQTVSILRDIKETSVIKVPADGIVLDLAGHDVEARIEVDSELELTDSGGDGKLWYTGANPIKVNGGGKLTMNGGTVEAITGSSKAGAIYVKGSADKRAEAVINGGTLICDNYNGALETQYATVTVNGGRFEGYAPMTFWRFSDVTINDADVECTQASEYHGECLLFCTERTWGSSYTGSMEDVNVVINGGTFKAKECYLFAHSNGTDVTDNAMLDIRGGYFTWPSDKGLLSAGTKKNIEYTIAGGHFCSKEFDNFFKEGEWYIPSKFCCDEDGFQTLEAAFAAAKTKSAPATVKMFADWTMTGKVTLESGNYTFDLQGHSLETPGSKRIDVSGGTLDIVSTGGVATYTQSATGGYFLMNITGGTVTSENVDYKCESTAAAIYVNPGSKTAKFVIGSGSISAAGNPAISAQSNSEVEINGGTMTSAAASAVYATNATISISGGTLMTPAESESSALSLVSGAQATITGGEFNSGSLNSLNCASGSNVTISGGTFNSGSTTLYFNASTGTITNGSFESVNLNALTLNNAAEVTVDGGTFRAVDHAAAYVNAATAHINDGDFNSSGHIALSCENGAVAVVKGGEFTTGEKTAVYLNDSEITVENGIFTSPNNHAIHCEGENGSTATIKGGTFTSTQAAASYYAGYFNNTAATISGGTFESAATSALSFSACPNPTITDGTFRSTSATALTVDGYRITISGGTFHSTQSYALLCTNGADVTINGGNFVSDGRTAVYLQNTTSNTMVIGGGAFICNNMASYSSGQAGYCYALYVGGSNHNLTVTNAVSEPCFYTESASVSSPVYGNSDNTVAVTAGYYNKGFVGESSNKYVTAGYEVSELVTAKTLTVEGKTYTLGYQLVPKL